MYIIGVVSCESIQTNSSQLRCLLFLT